MAKKNMNKNIKRGLLGIGIIALTALVFGAFSPWTILYSLSNPEFFENPINPLIYVIYIPIYIPMILLPPYYLFGGYLGILLTLVYWFILGNIVGFLYEKIKLRKKKKK